jgi:hypothetical protein
MCAPYSLCDIVYNHGTVRISVVHGCQRLVALLSSCVPDLELDCRLVVQGKGLCEESGADSGLSVIIELVLPGRSVWRSQSSWLVFIVPSQSGARANSFRRRIHLGIVSISCHRNPVWNRNPPRSTSLNCANRAPPGRPPCCIRWAMIGPGCGCRRLFCRGGKCADYGRAGLARGMAIGKC